MHRLAIIMLVLSTLVMLTIIGGILAWGVIALTSMSLGEALFVGIFTLLSMSVASWFGIRWGTKLRRQNEEAMARYRARRRNH